MIFTSFDFFIPNIITGLLLESQIVGSRNKLFANCQQRTKYITGRYRVNLALSRTLFSCDTTNMCPCFKNCFPGWGHSRHAYRFRIF